MKGQHIQLLAAGVVEAYDSISAVQQCLLGSLTGYILTNLQQMLLSILTLSLLMILLHSPLESALLCLPPLPYNSNQIH